MKLFVFILALFSTVTVHAEEVVVYDYPQQFVFFCTDRNGTPFAVEYVDVKQHSEEQCAAECAVLGNKIVISTVE